MAWKSLACKYIAFALFAALLAQPLTSFAGQASAAPAQAPKKAVASPAVQKEFAAFIEKFRAALKANDAAAVAGMTKLPFMNDASTRDAAQFREKVYKQDFTAKTRACLQRNKAVYDRAPDNSDNYSIFCGEEIFLFTRTPAGFLFTEIGMND
jgi:hypothetical protein